MRFVPSREQREFAGSLRELLVAAEVPSVVRSWSAGDADPGRKLWARLADQGVPALALPEPRGGIGATAVDLVLAFEELGRAAVPGPWVESAAVLPVLLAQSPDADRLDAIGAGTSIGTVALAPHVPYALDGAVADVVYLVRDGRLHRAAAGEPVASVDRARRLTTALQLTDLGGVDTAAALRAGALATAAQILGAGAAVLERSTAYARQRSQFGRPIGSFQAVKHQLADVAVALDLARPLLFGAALAIGTATADRDVSAAKVACTDAAYLAARTALQVHGAIGYTAEHDLALWLTKIRALTAAWGTQRVHRTRVLAAIGA